MRLKNKLQVQIVFVGLATTLGQLGTEGVAASSIPDNTTPHVSGMSATRSITQDKTVDGKEFLDEMSSSADGLKCYQFESNMTVYKGSKVIAEKVKFYFKKPKLIRAEEVGPFKKGAVAVLQKNGEVRGHLGGILSKITATVDARSEWVTSANDYPLVDSDYFSMMQVMLNFVKEGKKSIVTAQPVLVAGQLKPVYVLELYSDASQKELLKRAYVDPANLLPVEWFDYKEGKLFAHTLWKDLKVDSELSDSLFQI